MLLQSPESMTYKYVEGDFYNESLPASAKYADFMFKLSEKLKTAVSVRYLSPGEDLDPEALVTIADDDDLQVSRPSKAACAGASRSAHLQRCCTTRA